MVIKVQKEKMKGKKQSAAAATESRGWHSVNRRPNRFVCAAHRPEC
jgi:hypothetical protein